MELRADWAEALLNYLESMHRRRVAQAGRRLAAANGVKSVEARRDGRVYAQIGAGDSLTRQVALWLDENGDLAFEDGLNGEGAVAVALTLIGYGFDQGCERCWQGMRHLPQAWATRDAAPWASALRGAQTLFEAPAASTAAPLPAQAREDRWWRRFLRTENEAQQRQLLQQGIRERLGADIPKGLANEIADELLDFATPFLSLVAFDRICSELELHGIGRPPVTDLQEWLESDEARSLSDQMAQRQAEEELVRWLEPQRSTASSSLSASRQDSVQVYWNTPPAADGLRQLIVRVLVAAPGKEPEARTPQQLLALANDLLQGRRTLADPRAETFIRWLGTTSEVGDASFHVGAARGPLVIVQDASFWITRWGSTGLPFWEDEGCLGQTVEVSPLPARLTLRPVPEQRDHGEWRVLLPGEEGEGLSLSEVLVVTDQISWRPRENLEATAYVRRGARLWPLETGGMPRAVLSALVQMPRLPLQRLRSTAAGEKLARRLSVTSPGEAAPSAPSRDELIQEVPVRVAFEYRLRDRGNTLSVAARARSQEGVEWRRVAAEQWPPATGAAEEPSAHPLLSVHVAEQAPDADIPAPTGLALVRKPRAADLALAEEWIARLVPPEAVLKNHTDGTVSWCWAASPEALRALAEVWPERPRRADHLADGPMRDLFQTRRPDSPTVHAKTKGPHWLEVSVEWSGELERLSSSDVEDALARSTGDLIVLRGQHIFRRDDLEKYQAEMELLAELGIDPSLSNQQIHVLGMIGRPSEGLLKHAGDTGRLNDLAEVTRSLLANFRGVPAAAIAPETDAPLRVYQRQGADFLAWAGVIFGGAILADDMGLGKTLQMLAAITALRAHFSQDGKRQVLPCLVVCPASVTHNWQREIARFAPSMKRVTVLESGRGRTAVLKVLANYDLVITNYALARKDAEALAEQPWLAVVADEAQNIKNPRAEVSKAMKALTAHARFALTGTPVENRLAELWSILDFALPGYLGNVEGNAAVTGSGAQGGFDATALRALRARLRPVLLRRLKGDVAKELPPRIEERVDVEMTAPQRRAYLAQVKRTRETLQRAREARNSGEKGSVRMQILADLTRLRQICCDPALIGIEKAPSGKLEECLELVESLLEAGHKVLVFSQFVQMLRILQDALHERRVRLHLLHGGTQKRPKVVDAFEKDPEPCVFLISTKAGGAGLNLTSASHVILYDPWWNPAVEAQAIDRTHRIGQDKTVVALRLVTRGTIEERIYELQQTKRDLTRAVLDEGDFQQPITPEDVEELLENESYAKGRGESQMPY